MIEKNIWGMVMMIFVGWYDDGLGNWWWWDGMQWMLYVVIVFQFVFVVLDFFDVVVDVDVLVWEIVVVVVEVIFLEDVFVIVEFVLFVLLYIVLFFVDIGFVCIEYLFVVVYLLYGMVFGVFGVGQFGLLVLLWFFVLGVIGFIVVVVGVIVVCFLFIVLVGWGLFVVGVVLLLVLFFVCGWKWLGIIGFVVVVVGVVLVVVVLFIMFIVMLIVDCVLELFVMLSVCLLVEGVILVLGDDFFVIEGVEMVLFVEFQVGDCLLLVEYDVEDQIYDFFVVLCEQLYMDEIYYIFQIEGEGEFFGDDLFYEIVWDGCIVQFEVFVGVFYELLVFDVYLYQLICSFWVCVDDCMVYCIVFSYEDVIGMFCGVGY